MRQVRGGEGERENDVMVMSELPAQAAGRYLTILQDHSSIETHQSRATATLA